MADKFTFSLVSPERELIHGEVEHVVIPGAEGEFGVMAGHAPVLSVVTPGVLRVIDGGETRLVYVNGGFADVMPDGLTVLAEEAMDLSDGTITLADIESDMKDAQEDLRDASTEEQKAVAAARIARAETIRAALAPRAVQ